nr:hypothetical protein [Bacteroidia bacterium]
MKKLYIILLIMLTYSRLGFAQTLMPLPAHSSVFTSTLTRGFWFVAPVDFTISGLRVPTDPGSGDQYIQVMRFASTVPAFPTVIQPQTTLGYFTAIAGTGIITTNISVSAGDVIGILGGRLTTGTTLAQSYAATGTFATDILGNPVTITRLIHQASIVAGQAGDVSSETGGSLGRIEMYASPPGGPPSAIPPIASYANTDQDTVWIGSPSTIVNTSNGAAKSYWDILGFNATNKFGTYNAWPETRQQKNNQGINDDFIDT